MSKFDLYDEDPTLALDPELDSVDTDEEDELGYDDEDGLGYVGLSHRRLRRRARRARIAKRKKARRSRKGKKARARKARRIRRARRSRKSAPKAAAPKRRRRRRSRRKSAPVQVAAPARRRRRRSRSRRRRSAGMRGVGNVIGKLADTVALQSLKGLGAGKKRRRRKSKAKSRPRRRARVAARRRRKSGSRRRARRSRRRGGMRGLGSFGRLGTLSSNLADAEVAASMPVVGVVQHLFSKSGLEGIGGVGLGALSYHVVRKGLFSKVLKLNVADFLPNVGSAIASAVLVWEIGRLLGSGPIAKYGAFFALGKALEELVIMPYVVNKIPGLSGYGMSGYGLGQMRLPESAPLSSLSQISVPEDADLGQRLVAEEELLGEDMGAEGGEEESAIF